MKLTCEQVARAACSDGAHADANRGGDRDHDDHKDRHRDDRLDEREAQTGAASPAHHDGFGSHLKTARTSDLCVDWSVTEKVMRCTP